MASRYSKAHRSITSFCFAVEARDQSVSRYYKRLVPTLLLMALTVLMSSGCLIIRCRNVFCVPTTPFGPTLLDVLRLTDLARA
jgi:hypothetical protein